MHPALPAVAAAVEALGGQVIAPDRLLAGDLPIQVDGVVVCGVRPPDAHGVLDRLVERVERELGSPLDELDREGRRRAVGRLDELGAFGLRTAAERVGRHLGVSRFTVYNDLKSLHAPIVDRLASPDRSEGQTDGQESG